MIPVMIGQRMAKQTGLELGETVTARWRTHQGAFDARELEVVHIFDSSVPAVDQGQIWLPWEQLRDMLQVADHATVVVMKEKVAPLLDSFWRYQSLEMLLADTQRLVDSKSAGGSIFYAMLLFLAMIAIFDTQALAIFKRRKEIGTLMALGMTPRRVLGLFTLEGMLQGFLAFGVTLVLGGPLFWYLSRNGIPMPVSGDEYGLALSDTIYPAFSLPLILGTFFLIMFLLTVVSYWPARHISRLLPSDALRVR